ncbi:aspartate ammonia-lyase [Culicoidibacter larvae]|uniref:Aspartate ammonia-lyase n=1 Tax=Culicoidibacter larvae TaxID=2579976 RepID=A0A5R8QI05_9FIRM|nr:aspartate ammonia-lyase [Culicoidibacter larvae]TLG77320.1 aspartate ammonia-lyase [Culicoidibacter larvae]
MSQEVRIERDSLGEIPVPKMAYYGIATERAKRNFNISGVSADKKMIYALVIVKKAAALANHEVGSLSLKKCRFIEQACDEILAGKFDDEFVTDSIQGGAGTSFNMNVNEVIANRANELAGFALGSYSLVHPNDDVNMGQSTNDVVPTAAKLALIWKAEVLGLAMNRMIAVLLDLAEEFDDVIKLGRTHLQDAVPIRLGQVFAAFASVHMRELNHLEFALSDMHVLNMGATAVGTGITASRRYIELVTGYINELSGIYFLPASNLVDATRHTDYYTRLSASLKNCAVSLSKMCNDLRLMASGPRGGLAEIILPPVQPGSSIMPGKVNPVIPEVVNQVCFSVIGNDVTVSKAVEAGQLELNVFAPVIVKTLLESISLLTQAIDTLTEKALTGLQSNRENCSLITEHSAGVATALIPYIGYDRASSIAKESLARRVSVREILLEEHLFDEVQLDEILNVYHMTEIR